MGAPEAWLQGPVEGVHAELQPAAHSLLQSLHIFSAALPSLDNTTVNEKLGDAATIAFHALHAAGSIDRMLTYAHGKMLTAEQYAAKERESEPWAGNGAELYAPIGLAIERGLDVIRKTNPRVLNEVRLVGSKQLPSTVRGLMFHLAEHTLLHAGQVRTTLRAMQRDP